MRKKIFAVSDLHGYYAETIAALENAGFDEANPEHLLVVCGDMFDRGEQSLAIFNWLYQLNKEGKAVVLRGNHEPFLIEWLEGPVSNFNYLANGLRSTLDDFLGRTNAFLSWIMVDRGFNLQSLSQDDYNALWYIWSAIARQEIKDSYPELLEWLHSLPNFFETKNYIFTHGSIQTYGDWKNPAKGWDWHHWNNGNFFGENIINTEKTVVVGHFGTAQIRDRYKVGSSEDFSILKRDDNAIIMIDGCTAASGLVNVFTVEDEA